MNPYAIALITHFEGFRAKAYKCPAGRWTVGLGSTYHYLRKRDVDAGDEVTFGQALHLIDCELAVIERVLSKREEYKRLNEPQAGALMSLAYNWGVNKVLHSQVFHFIGLEDFVSAKKHWLEIVYAGGRVLKGLQDRRVAEWSVFIGE